MRRYMHQIIPFPKETRWRWRWIKRTIIIIDAKLTEHTHGHISWTIRPFNRYCWHFKQNDIIYAKGVCTIYTMHIFNVAVIKLGAVSSVDGHSDLSPYIIMMTLSNGNIFSVTGPLCREFTDHQWISRTKASDADLWCFLWSAPE